MNKIIKTKEREVGRRSFLKWTGLSLLGSNFLSVLNPRLSFAGGVEAQKNYWKKNPAGEDYCIHNTVKIDSLNSDFIYAKVDN
jgi:hypothetical protein